VDVRRTTRHRLVLPAIVFGLLAVANPQPIDGSVFGTCAHIPTAPIQDKIVDAGIQWVRIDVIWAAVETAEDTFQWDLYDLLLDRLEARGLKIMATVAGTPAWATSGSEFIGAPDDPADFRDFCYIAASRYRGRIDAWGFWNEPNLDHFWEGSRNQYIHEILVPGIEAVRRVDPDALVVGPDLAHLSSGHWDDWLDEVVSETRHLLDVVTHHTYPSDGSAGDVTDKLTEGGQFPWDPPSVRSVLADAGWERRPFWLTETGVESDVYGEAGQESFYLDLLDHWFAPDPDHSWIDRIFFYEIVDPGNAPELSWGILEAPPGLEPKLAYHAYEAFIDEAVVDDAEIDIQGLPRFMGSHEVADLLITVTNTGTTTWNASDGYLLLFHVTTHRWVHEVEPIAVNEPVEPGESVVLAAVLGSPFISEASPTREVPVSIRMTRIGAGYFGEAPPRAVIHTAYSPATVTVHPAAAISHINGVATFTTEADSETDAEYQWRRNTFPLTDDHQIDGTTTPTLTVRGIGFDDLGDYDCVVTNAAGSIVSKPAALTLTGSPIRRPSGRVGEASQTILERWNELRKSHPRTARTAATGLGDPSARFAR
jgi:hypothetical protein